MNLKKQLLPFMLTALAASSFVGPASAAATNQLYSSNAVGACISAGGIPRYEWDGLYNDSATENMHLECSLPATTASVGALSEDDFLGIYGKNRSVSEDLTCGFKVVTGTGFVVYETSDHQAFAKTVPANTPGGGFMIFGVNGMGFSSPVYASCKIPKKQGSSGYSGLNSLFFASKVFPD